MTAPYRWLALSAAELVLLFVVFTWQQGSRPFTIGVRVAMPALMVTLVPYVILTRRLAHGYDAKALLITVVLALMAGGILALVGASYFLVMPFVIFGAFPMYVAGTMFVATQVALVRSSIAAISAGPGIGATVAAGFWPAAALVVVGLAVAAATLADATRVMERTEYSVEVAQRHLLNVFNCLQGDASRRGAPRFPASGEELQRLGPACWDPAIAPGGRVSGTAYEFRYSSAGARAGEPAAGFVLETRSHRPWRGESDSWSVDHLATIRHSTTGWASTDGRAQDVDPRPVVRLMAMLDAYREVHGHFPANLVEHRPSGIATAGAMPLRDGIVPGAAAFRQGDDGGTILTDDTGRLLVSYAPAAPVEGKPASYRLVYLARRRTLQDLRSYLVEPGQVHVTAENRVPMPGDPLHAAPALARSVAEERAWALHYIKEVTTAR